MKSFFCAIWACRLASAGAVSADLQVAELTPGIYRGPRAGLTHETGQIKTILWNRCSFDDMRRLLPRNIELQTQIAPANPRPIRNPRRIN